MESMVIFHLNLFSFSCIAVWFAVFLCHEEFGTLKTRRSALQRLVPRLARV